MLEKPKRKLEFEQENINSKETNLSTHQSSNPLLKEIIYKLDFRKEKIKFLMQILYKKKQLFKKNKELKL